MLSTPPLLLGLTLLLWGWQLGQLWLGALAAIVLECARLAPWRFELSERTARRAALISLLLTLSLVGDAIILTSMQGNLANSLLTASAWLPMAFIPALTVQAWGDQADFDLRQFRPRCRHLAPARTNLAWPGWTGTLLAACIAPSQPTPWFYAALCVLVAWAMWVRKTPRRPLRWLPVMLIACSLGLFGHIGLHSLHHFIEEHFGEWYLGTESGSAGDSDRSTTAIGRVGKLKMSERIMLRVYPAQALTDPLLLREASYTSYRGGVWVARAAGITPLVAAQSGRDWSLQRQQDADASLRIRYTPDRESALLPLPGGATSIHGLPASLAATRLGTVRVSAGPTHLDYAVTYAPSGPDMAGAPTPLDLEVPPEYTKLFAGLVTRLQLSSVNAEQAVGTTREYFQRNFRYSLVQRDPLANSYPLEYFLLHSQAGHCEYFATATVLLLRSAGIPARYATGYSVQEYSPWERAYRVRARHAHAWAQAFVDGRWQDVDSTPARWAAAEAEEAPALQFLADFANQLLAGLQQLFSDDTPGHGWAWAWLLVPLIALAGWRLQRVRRIRPTTVAPGEPTPPRPGLDSEWYALEQTLATVGLTRKPWESTADWVERIAPAFATPEAVQTLRAMAALHCRYRFDPQGLDAAERTALRDGLAALRLMPVNAPGG